MSVMRRPRPPAFGSILRVGISLSPKIPDTVDFDVSEPEYSAIGFTTVHWSFLEFALYYRTVIIAADAGVAIPDDAKSATFTRRLAAFRILVEEVAQPARARTRWLGLAGRITTVAGQRGRVTHGLWSYNARQPDRLWATDQRNPNARSEAFDPDKINELGAAMGAISFVLIHPDGVRLEEIFSTPYASRSAQLMFQGKERLDQGLLDAIVRASKRPRSSSRRSLRARPRERRAARRKERGS